MACVNSASDHIAISRTQPLSSVMDEVKLWKSITVTNSLDLESTSSAVKCPSRRDKSADVLAVGVVSGPTVRISSSTSALRRSSPSLTRRLSSAQLSMSARHTTLTSTQTWPEDKLNATRVPQHRQSKLSERSCGSSLPVTPLIATGDERPMTAREKCMEQQRASPPATKQASPKTSTESSISWFNENQSQTRPGELSRSASVPTGRAPKVAMESRSSSIPSKWANYVLSLRNKGPRYPTPPKQYGSSDAEQSLRKVLVGKRLRTKPWAHLGSKPVVVEENTNDASTDEVDLQPAKDKRPTSLISYLHDPDKIKKFSLELESLVNSDFERKWQDAEQDFFTQGAEPTRDTDSPVDAVSPTSTDPVVENAPKGLGIEANAVEAPAKPQTEALGDHTLAHVASFSKLSVTPNTSSSKANTLPDARLTSGIEAETAQPGTNLHLRLAPTFANSNRSSRSLKHSPSTDTLTVIDSELMKDPQISALGKISRKASFINHQSKCQSSSPSGEPPSGPLPALPTTDMPLLPTPAKKPAYLDNALGRIQPGESRPTSRATLRHSQNSDVSKGRSMQASQGNATESARSLAVRSALDIRSSSELSRPMRPKNSGVQPDSASTRSAGSRIQNERGHERHTGEVTESNVTALPLPDIPSPQPRPDHDKRLPAPPSQSHSRSSSQRTHSRTSTNASSIQQGIQPATQRQALSKSAIKIIVDTDPNTGHFRAGGIAPASSVASSPKKRKTSTQLDVNDPTPVRRHGGRKRGAKSQRRDIATRANARRQMARYGSHDCEIASEDEVNPLLAPHYSGNNTRTLSLYKPHLNDADLMSVKFDHLAAEVVDIRTELKKQKDSIALMGSVVGFGRPCLPPTVSKYRDSVGVISTTATKNSYHHIDHDIHGYAIDMRPISSISSGSTSTTTGRSTTLASAGSGGEGSITDPSECSDLSPTPLKKRMELARNKASMKKNMSAPLVNVARTTAHRDLSHLSLRGEEWPWPSSGQTGGKSNRKEWSFSVNIAPTTSDVMDRHLEDMRAW